MRLAGLACDGPLPDLLALAVEGETGGFKNGTTDFAAQWRSRGGKAACGLVRAATHFTILDHIARC